MFWKTELADILEIPKDGKTWREAETAYGCHIFSYMINVLEEVYIQVDALPVTDLSGGKGMQYFPCAC